MPISVTFAVNVLPLIASTVIVAGLSELDVRDVGLVDFDLRLDHRHVGDLQQDRAGVVHRADHRRLALLDVPARDDAVDRRLDADLAEIGLGVLERRLLLLRAQLQRAEVLLLRGEVGLAHRQVGLRLFERFLRRQPALGEVLLAAVGVLGLLERRARALEREPHLLELRSRRAERGFAALDSRAQVARVDLQQELSLLDAVAFVDRQLGHASARVGADVDEPFRLDLARRRDDRLRDRASGSSRC